MADHTTYAEVAVHTPMARRLQTAALPLSSGSGPDDPAALGMTFHYSVPADLRGQVQPGSLVWVPFGKEQLHGVTLSLTDTVPQGVTPRPIIDLVLPDPVCTAVQLDLARWLSAACLAPLLDCLLLMLPTGLALKAESVYELTRQALRELAQESPPASSPQLAFATEEFTEALHPAGYFPQFPGLKPEQHAVISLLREHGQVREHDLARHELDLSRRSILDPLIEQGLVARRRRIVDSPIKPKTERQVTLLVNQETIERVLPTLGRSSKQADVLAWLAGHGMPASVKDVCAAVGCSPSPVKSLARRGWVEIDSEKIVRLVAPLSDVPEHLIELRGGEKYRRVLQTLANEAGPVWIGWLYAEVDTNLATLRDLEAAGVISLGVEEVWRDPLAGKEFVADSAPSLTEDQARVWAEIEKTIVGDDVHAGARRMNSASGSASRLKPAQAKSTNLLAEGPAAPDREHLPGNSFIHGETHGKTDRDTPNAFLLHGVTGSGKTEIYLRAIEATLRGGRQAIALVPEIALTPQTVRRFAARFGQRVTIYHSGLSPGERYDVWRRARTGAVDVIVGTRSALFLPMPRLGLIILDEEHDPSFKESQRPPRYHARESALRLGQLTGAVVILGSATPSLEAYHRAQLGQMRLLEMPRRIMGHARAIDEQQRRWHLANSVYRPVAPQLKEARYADLPPVHVVDLRQELRAGNRSMFSRALHDAIGHSLAAGQQAILFLNRRGTATFIMCRDCGHVLTCEHCDVPLTYHEGRSGRGVIVCHHCGRRAGAPERCPECESRRIRYLGAGTEKVSDLVSTLWPQARVVRWDRDLTGRKGSHEAILDQFTRHEADIMVGTQMIAKGLDLPLVTLVGVISADVGLYLPDFRAAERSFQLLTQVAGRAGRSPLGGQVIIQSYRPEHYVIQAARRHDYLDFYRQEISFRRQLGYPPFRRLARLLFIHQRREKVQEEAEALARGLKFAIAERGLTGVDLIGPAPCFFGREQGKYRWQIVVRAIDPASFLRTVEIPQGWRVDVDPISLL
ncbi:MAG: primosomal protein N' [Anaerolineae bacterium]|nr:primosomal protein N' [Anaerolineae bacterium]